MAMRGSIRGVASHKEAGALAYPPLPSSDLVRRACPGMRVVAVATRSDPQPRPRHASGTSGLQFCSEMAWVSLLGRSADGGRSDRKRPR
jgi:hypothetical protein